MIEIIYDHRMSLRDSAIRHFIIHKGTIILLSHFRSFYFKRFKVAAVMLVIDLIVKRYKVRIFSGDIIQDRLFEAAPRRIAAMKQVSVQSVSYLRYFPASRILKPSLSG